jgi:hypothetical protein
MSEIKSDPLKTICDLKWNYPIFNLERGEFRSCCRTPSRQISEEDLQNLGPDAFLNSPHMIQSRLDLIRGVKHEDCNSCWKLEEANAQSPRHSNQYFFELLQMAKFVDNNLKYSDDTLRAELKKFDDINHPVLKSTRPYMLEISLGNTCDMKCMYCSHHYSTQWAAEKIKYNEITQELYDREFPKAPNKFTETFWEWFDSVKEGVGRIGIIGGEPLIMPEFYEFLNKLIDNISTVKNTRKKNFWIVTNLNTPPNYLEKFFNYLPKLTEVFNVEILASMESTGKQAEYIRNGVHWDRFESNIDKLLTKNLNFDFGFIMSVNALSIPDVKDFIQYTEQIYLKYNKPVALKQNIITYPNWQSPFILTPDYANYIDECIDYMKTKVDVMPIVEDKMGRWDEYIKFLETLAKSIRENKDDNTYLRQKFVEWFDTYDLRRKLNFKSTFPKLEKFYDMCKQL